MATDNPFKDLIQNKEADDLTPQIGGPPSFGPSKKSQPTARDEPFYRGAGGVGAGAGAGSGAGSGPAALSQARASGPVHVVRSTMSEKDLKNLRDNSCSRDKPRISVEALTEPRAIPGAAILAKIPGGPAIAVVDDPIREGISDVARASDREEVSFTLERLESENRKLTVNLQALSREKAQLMLENTQINERQAQLESDIKKLDEKDQNQEKEIQRLKRDLASSEENFRRLEIDFEKDQKKVREAKDLRNKLKNLNLAAEKNKRKIEQVIQELETAVLNLKTADEKIALLEKKLRQKDVEIQQKDEAIQRANQANEELKRRVDTLTRELNSVKALLKKEQAKLEKDQANVAVAPALAPAPAPAPDPAPDPGPAPGPVLGPALGIDLTNPAVALALGLPPHTSPDTDNVYNTAEMIEKYKKEAEKGDKEAHYRLGICYLNGVGGEKNMEKAASRFERAAKKGHPKAKNKLVEVQYRIGISYIQMLGGKDWNKAKIWLQKAADEEQILEKAADEKRMLAQYELALVYKHTEDVDNQQKWLLKAAQKGHAASQYELGILYESGKFRDLKKMMYWLGRAEKQGHAEAKYCLGELYRKGKGGVPKNNRLALEYFISAATEGCIKAQIAVADIYRKGELIEQDLRKALFWYRQAEEKIQNPALLNEVRETINEVRSKLNDSNPIAERTCSLASDTREGNESSSEPIWPWYVYEPEPGPGLAPAPGPGPTPGPVAPPSTAPASGPMPASGPAPAFAPALELRSEPTRVSADPLFEIKRALDVPDMVEVWRRPVKRSGLKPAPALTGPGPAKPLTWSARTRSSTASVASSGPANNSVTIPGPGP